MQCDGYNAYKQLAGPARDGPPVTLAFCWSHVRRGFYDPAKSGTSPIATEALVRIAALYRIETEIRGKDPAERLAKRQELSRPLVTDLRLWFEAQLKTLPPRGPLAELIRYPLNHWSNSCQMAALKSVKSTTGAVVLGHEEWLFSGGFRRVPVPQLGP